MVARNVELAQISSRARCYAMEAPMGSLRGNFCPASKGIPRRFETTHPLRCPFEWLGRRVAETTCFGLPSNTYLHTMSVVVAGHVRNPTCTLPLAFADFAASCEYCLLFGKGLGSNPATPCSRR
eukprot:COSAG06_NODE_3068_length_5896_cov_126.296360_9_plen_124_part_00